MTRWIVAAVLGVLLIIGATLAIASAPSPAAAAKSFIADLPGNTQQIHSLASPALRQQIGFWHALAQWRSRDRAARWTLEQGPEYGEVLSESHTAATVLVVSHYAEVNPSGKALNWEQDFAVELTRGLFGPWQVSRVRTTAMALVQVIGTYPRQGPTQIAVPPAIYLPTK